MVNIFLFPFIDSVTLYFILLFKIFYFAFVVLIYSTSEWLVTVNKNIIKKEIFAATLHNNS